MNPYHLSKNSRFLRSYSILTCFALAICILSSVISVTGNVMFQTISSILFLVGLVMLFGESVYVIAYVDKRSTMGWILHRMAYSILFLMSLAGAFITLGTYISSFYLLGNDTLKATSLISSISITTVFSFGICLSSISYHSVKMQDVWQLGVVS